MTASLPQASILLVEDDAGEARRLADALAHLGLRCTLAEDGDAALARLASERFDLILLDLVLPGLDGMGVLRALAARGIPTPVVVAVSAAGIDGARSALKAGARDFVVKPAGALRLEVAIGNALALARLDAAARPGPDGGSASGPGAVPLRAAAPADPAPDAAHVIALPLRPAPPPMAMATGTTDPFLDARGHVRTLEAIEAEAIRFALSFYGGHMSEAARHLGIGRSTLYRKLAALDPPAPEPYAPAFVAAE